jgi:hypothetical protein
MDARACFSSRTALLAILVWAGPVLAQAQTQVWPEVKAPPNARVETIASSMVLNGKPSRLTRFEVRASDAEVLAFYREQFGAKRVVENRVKNNPVIATRRGDHFITVQLHALGADRLQGTVMTTLLTAKAASSTVLVDTQKLLPSDTKVVSTLQTDDAGKQSLMVVGVNQNSPRANRDHVLEAMLARGFRMTKEDVPAAGQETGVIMVQLSSPTEEASVTISDAGRYRSVLINRVRGAP